MADRQEEPATEAVKALAHALEWVRDPDEPRRTVVPTGYPTLLSSEIPAIREKQAELILRHLYRSGTTAGWRIEREARVPAPDWWQRIGEWTHDHAIYTKDQPDTVEVPALQAFLDELLSEARVPAPLDVEQLAAALKAEGFVRGVAARYGTFNDPYWEQSAAAILARLSSQPSTGPAQGDNG